MGPGRALYCGPLQYLETHVYGTSVLHVGVYRPFRIRLEDGHGWRSCRCVAIPAGTRHALDLAGGIHGKLFVERDGPYVPGFTERFGPSEAGVRFFEDEETIECFRWVYEDDPNREAVERRLDGLTENGLRQVLITDTRIRLAIDLMGREPDRNFSQNELASAVDLSPSRFLHLFRATTGVPYRRFRTWKRLLHCFELLHARDHLTRAAVDAGFADLAHFSRSFRETFGINPAPVFRHMERFDISP